MSRVFSLHSPTRQFSKSHDPDASAGAGASVDPADSPPTTRIPIVMSVPIHRLTRSIIAVLPILVIVGASDSSRSMYFNQRSRPGGRITPWYGGTSTSPAATSRSSCSTPRFREAMICTFKRTLTHTIPPPGLDVKSYAREIRWKTDLFRAGQISV